MECEEARTALARVSMLDGLSVAAVHERRPRAQTGTGCECDAARESSLNIKLPGIT